VVFAVRGLVVIVPLVGWAPLHPPEAMHECAPVVLQCKVVELPLGTLVLFAARVTAGFAVSLEAAVAVLTVEELVFDVSADDSPQAASAANTAHPSAQPNTRPTNPILVSVTFVGGTHCRYFSWRGVFLISTVG
jgi:hypothetical protein